MSTLIILQQMCVIALLVVIGFFLYRKDVLDDHTTKKLSFIITNVCNPALALSVVLSGQIQANHHDMLVALFIAFLIYLMLCILGLIVPRILRVKKDQRKYFNMMTVYANIGFMGIPIGKALLSDTAMLYVIILNVMFGMYFYTHGYLTMAEGAGLQLKKLLNPGFILAIVTILIAWFDLHFPDVINNTVSYVGNATVFISMGLLGASIAKASLRDVFTDIAVYPFTLIKMLVIPIAFALTLKAFHVDQEMILAFVLLISMPCANMPLILAEMNGEETRTLSHGIIMTTLVSIATITIVMSII